MLEYYGRDKELKIIKEFLNLPYQANLLIYGRRIGKSYLIKKDLEDTNLKVINYQCKDINKSSTLADLNELVRIKLNAEFLYFNNIDKFLDYLFSLDDLYNIKIKVA